MNTRKLSESFDLQEAMGGIQIDDANGVVQGVVLLTGNKTSLNKTHYTNKALAEAVTRYEGAKMYIDHPKNGEVNRSIQDFGGVYKNVRLDGDKVRADLHLLESKRTMVMSIAKMKPAGIGLSIKDRGHGVEKDGVFFVEGFAPKASHSIDLVAEPSVNKDLFEATQSDEKQGGDEMDFKTLTLETLKKERPDLVELSENAGKAAILKELDEAKASGKKSDVLAAKLGLLIETDFPKEVRESVKTMVIADEIGIDAAKAIITGQKALIESLHKKTKTEEPVITGMGRGTTKDVVEGALPSEDDVLGAFRR